MLQAWLDHRRLAGKASPPPRIRIDERPPPVRPAGRRRRRLRRRATTTTSLRLHDDDELEDELRGRVRRGAAGVVAAADGSSWSCSCCCSCSAVALGGAALWVQRQLDPPGDAGRAPGAGDPRGLHLRRHRQAARRRRAIISSELVWSWYLRINGGGPFQAGTYELADNSAIADVIDTLDDGPGADRGALLHGPRGAHPHRDPRSPGRPRGGPRLRPRHAPAAHGQRSDPLVRAARRPAVERGDPVPRDLPHRGGCRRGRPSSASWSASSRR